MYSVIRAIWSDSDIDPIHYPYVPLHHNASLFIEVIRVKFLDLILTHS